jgi:hypothetical protein
MIEDIDAEYMDEDEVDDTDNNSQGNLDKKVTKKRDSGSITTSPSKTKDYGTLEDI